MEIFVQDIRLPIIARQENIGTGIQIAAYTSVLSIITGVIVSPESDAINGCILQQTVYSRFGFRDEIRILVVIIFMDDKYGENQ
ncbi:hypothetical protein [Pectinatus frisingensis]|uniref:hypothetical protein n=1 Tax=Pectinatus frisingensis TaxID=865 RepID=UPI0018C79A41|nr:hypothetical protein [Pectinatus frisingensis]